MAFGLMEQKILLAMTVSRLSSSQPSQRDELTLYLTTDTQI